VTAAALSDFSIPQNEALPKLKNLKKLIVIRSPPDGVSPQLIFSRVQSLENLYMRQNIIDHRLNFERWERVGVLQGDTAPKKEVITNFADL